MADRQPQSPTTAPTSRLQAWRGPLLAGLGAALIQWLGTQTVRVEPLQPDTTEYLTLAKHLLAHGDLGFGDNWRADPILRDSFQAFAYEAENAAFRPPGFPALLALLDPGNGIAQRIQALLVLASALTGALLFAATRQWAGVGAAAVAAVLWAVVPSTFASTRGIAREGLLAPIAVALLWGTLALAEGRAGRRLLDGRPQWLLAFALGLLAGVGTLVKETVVLVLGAGALWLTLRALRVRQLQQALLAGVLVMGACVATVPWVVRNSVAQGRVTGLTTMGPVATSLAWVPRSWPMPAADDSLPADSPRRVLAQLEAQTRDFVSREPGQAAMAYLRNLAWFWSPWPRYSPANDWKAPAVAAFYVLLYMAALVGAWRRRLDPLVQLLVLTLGLVGLAHGFSLATPRYRGPFDSLLCMLAAGGVNWHTFFKNRRRQTPVAHAPQSPGPP